MFDLYDDNSEDYTIVHHDGEKTNLTAQSLYEFIVLNETDLTDSFESIKRRLDSGEEIIAGDYSYDWNIGSTVYKGRLKIYKRSQHEFKREYLRDVPPIINSPKCHHKNKYINEAGGIKFWFCKDCKSDLGDV